MSSKGVMEPLTEDEPRVRKAAFQLLLTRHQPIEPAALAEQVGMAPVHLIEVLDQVDRVEHPRRLIQEFWIPSPTSAPMVSSGVPVEQEAEYTQPGPNRVY